MSTSRHFDRFCIAAVAVTLVLTILFMCGGSHGLSVAAKTVKYESTLFDTSYVHRIDIVMNDWDSFIETCDNEEYAACTVVVDGVKHANIAIRAKGNTSLSSVRSSGSQRYSFKLEFDHFESAKTLDGLDKLCLNNLIQDNTMMKDYLAYMMMNDFGADSPLCSFAYLTVNGEDWGLYLAVEGIEDSFLSRNYGSKTGELYKPDSMSFGGGRGNGKGFNFDDLDFDFGNMGGDQQGSSSESGGESSGNQGGFDPGSMFPGGDFSGGNFPGQDDGQGGFDPGSMFPGGQSGQSGDGQTDGSGRGGKAPGGFGGFGGLGSDDVKLKYIDDDPSSYPNIFDNAKTTVSSADQKRLIESLKKLSSYTDLESVLDMDEVLRYFVVHNFVCNGDSYTGSMIHNYYLHESDGKLGMIPWDYNLAYGTFQGGDASSSVNASIDSPVSGGMDDRPMVGWIFSDESYTERYHELFSEFIARWFTNGELESLIANTAAMLRPYVEKDPTKFCTLEEFDNGVQVLSEFVSLRAEAVSRQLSGNSTAVEASGLNLSEMGSMGGGMGGNIPGGSGFDPASMIKLTDKDGNAVELSSLIEDTSSISALVLSDCTEIGLSSSDMRSLVNADLSTAVSLKDKDGNSIDISEYTVSFSMPSGSGRGSGSGNGGQRPTSSQGSSSGSSSPSESAAPGGSQSFPGGSFPDQGSFPGGSFPDQGGFPGGSGSQDFSGGSFPGGSQGFPDQGGSGGMPSGSPQDQADGQSASPDSGSSGRQQPPSGGFSPSGGMPSGAGGNAEAGSWILVGVSALVLIAGIFIAVKVKH